MRNDERSEELSNRNLKQMANNTLTFKFCPVSKTGSGDKVRIAKRYSNYIAICIDDHKCAMRGCEIDLDVYDSNAPYNPKSITIPFDYTLKNTFKLKFENHSIIGIEQKNSYGDGAITLRLDKQNIIHSYN